MSKELKLYKFISKLSSYFIKYDDFDVAVNKALKALSKTTKTHRTYIFTLSKKQSLMTNEYEYCKKGIPSEQENFKNISTEPIQWWMSELNHKGIIKISDVSIMPQAAKFEQEDLERQQIKSILCFSLTIKGELIGFIGLDDLQNSRIWKRKTIELLKLSSKIVSSAFEKKLQKQKLSRINSALEATLESTKDGIVVIKQDGEILNYNQNFLTMLSVPKKVIQKKTYRFLFQHARQQIVNTDTFDAFMKDLLSDKKSQSTHIAMKKNGDILEIHTKPIYVKNKHLGRIWSCSNVTQKKNYEAKLELLSRVFKSSSAAIAITNRKNEIVDINHSFIKVSGYSKEELIGKTPTILQSKWHDAKFYKNLWKVLNKNLKWTGEIWDRKKSGELYLNRTQIHKVVNNEQVYYISIAQDITKERKYEERIEKLAFYDILTNLPNRCFFNEQLESIVKESKRYEKQFALLFLDLDNFKEVNDSFGHLIGDKLLQYVGKILTANVRSSDVVSRLSGDEFTIIIKDIQDYTNIIHTCNTIIEKLSTPITIEKCKINIGCSIGVSIYPNHAISAKDLVLKADTAMYSSKHFGKNQFSFHYEEMNDDTLKFYNHKRYQTMKELR